MRTRLYKTSDYNALREWWASRWGSAPVMNALPLSGVIVEDDEQVDLAAGWLYLDMTTSVGVVGFLVTNPENNPATSRRALILLQGGLIELALSQGRDSLVAAVPSGSLARLLKGCGYEGRDADMEHLILDLNQWQSA